MEGHQEKCAAEESDKKSDLSFKKKTNDRLLIARK